MNREKFEKKYYVILYSVLVLAITWIISIAVFSNPKVDLESFSPITLVVAAAMFLPAILAVVFKRIQYKNRKAKFQFSIKKLNKKALLFSIFYPIAFITVCAVIALVINIGEVDYNKIPDLAGLFQIFISIIINLIIVLGEEYGWRGYLLPELTKTVGKIKANVIVGTVWALYHVPVVYFSAKATGMSTSGLICIIQAAVVFSFSFAFSYCYYLSENLIPVLLLHSVWNEINTAVLGNITSKEHGILHGKLIYINGEGILGLILSSILVFWFIRQFRKETHFSASI